MASIICLLFQSFLVIFFGFVLKSRWACTYIAMRALGITNALCLIFSRCSAAPWLAPALKDSLLYLHPSTPPCILFRGRRSKLSVLQLRSDKSTLLFGVPEYHFSDEHTEEDALLKDSLNSQLRVSMWARLALFFCAIESKLATTRNKSQQSQNVLYKTLCPFQTGRASARRALASVCPRCCVLRVICLQGSLDFEIRQSIWKRTR